jgi:hypothetical protein
MIPVIGGPKNKGFEDVKDVKGMVDVSVKLSSNSILDKGEHPPIAIIVTEDKVYYAQIGSLMKGPELKDVLTAVLRKLAKDMNAVGLAIISEAWMCTATNKEDIKKMDISGNPDRFEILWVFGEWKGQDNLSRILRIERNPEGKPIRLIEVDSESHLKGMKGRFGSFFKEGEEENNEGEGWKMEGIDL